MNASIGVIRNIQVLRAVAALLVVFVHLNKLLLTVGVPSFGGGGVDVFFVISGFIMVYTTSNRDVTPGSFMADRITRIVPIYWLVTLAVFAVALVLPSVLQATKADWGELVESLLFIPFSKANGLIQPVLFVGWTLNYEMFFYLLFALGLACPPRFGRLGVIAHLMLLVGAGSIIHPVGVLGQFYTGIIMLDFALGMFVGMIYPRIPHTVPLALKAFVALIVCVGLFAVVVVPVLHPSLPSFLSSGIPAFLVVTGALALERWNWSLRSRLLLLLGNASYAIYLTHPFVTQVFQKIGDRLPGNRVAAVALIGTALVCVCCVGVLVYRCLEQPMLRALRRLLRIQRLSRQMDDRKAIL